MSTLDTLFTQHPWIYSSAIISALLLASWLANFITKRIVLRLIRRIVSRMQNLNNQDMIDLPIAARLANIIPILVISVGILLVPDVPAIVITVVHNICTAFIVLTIAVALTHMLDYLNIAYLRKPEAHNRPIKGYIQVGKLAVYLVAGVLAVSLLIDKNPLILLSGLGAMAAVLMLMFQDTILSLVASIQIGSSGVVRVGDWIEMPQLNADGDVIDMALYTVTVRNWDNTYTIFPTKKLVTESFKNWRGMSESGGRRIKRALYLDQTSVHFLSEEEIQNLKRFMVLDDYLNKKAAELRDWNQKLLDQGKDAINSRRVTNIGTFRAYVNHFLRHHPKIHQEMTLLVRQLQPGANGIPLEIYCFSNDTRWSAYEDIQSDIFDHLLAILPQFGLRVFQQPSGADLRDLLQPR